jgi:hypothetical protein
MRFHGSRVAKVDSGVKHPPEGENSLFERVSAIAEERQLSDSSGDLRFPVERGFDLRKAVFKSQCLQAKGKRGPDLLEASGDLPLAYKPIRLQGGALLREAVSPIGSGGWITFE